MKKDITLKKLDIREVGASALAFIQRYAAVLFIVTFLTIYSFLIYRINSFAQAEPTEDAIAEKLERVQRLNIDEDAVTKIQELQDQSVQVDALFDKARSNPFSE